MSKKEMKMEPLIKKTAVCWDMDTSESFLVGTKENLRNLAESILDQLEQDTKESELCGIKVQSPTSNGSLTESGLDIVLNGMAIVESEKDTFKIINKLRSINGMLPFAEDE